MNRRSNSKSSKTPQIVDMAKHINAVEFCGILSEKALARKCVRAYDVWTTARQMKQEEVIEARSFPVRSDFIKLICQICKISKSGAYRVLESGIKNHLWELTVNRRTGKSHVHWKSFANVKHYWVDPNPKTGKRYTNSFQLRSAKLLRKSIKLRRCYLQADSAERRTDHPRSQKLMARQTSTTQPTVSRRLKAVRNRTKPKAQPYITYNHRVVAKSGWVPRKRCKEYYQTEHEFQEKLKALQNRKGSNRETRPYHLQPLFNYFNTEVRFIITTPAPATYRPTGKFRHFRKTLNRKHASEARFETSSKTQSGRKVRRVYDVEQNILAEGRGEDMNLGVPYVRQHELSCADMGMLKCWNKRYLDGSLRQHIIFDTDAYGIARWDSTL